MFRLGVFGNCQAECLTKFLNKALRNDPSEIRWFASYEPRTEEQIAYLKQADLILEQISTPDFFTLDSEIKGDKPVLKFPYVGGTFLWPFEQAHPKNYPLPYLPRGPFPNDVGNIFLNRIIQESASPEEALDRWFNTDIKEHINLDRIFHMTKTLMKKIGSNSDFCLWEEVEKTFCNQRLFWTSQHASRILLEKIIFGVLDILKIPLSKEEITNALQEDRYDIHCLHHPLHPQIIEHFGLKWCDSTTKYKYYDEDFYTYQEFIKKYVYFEFDDELLRGTSLTREGKEIPSAERLIREGLQRHPNSPYALDELAKNLELQGKLNEALNVVEKAAQLCAEVPRFQFRLASIESKCGLHERANQSMIRYKTLLQHPI